MTMLYIGDVVEFNYKGGSTPGAKRVAYVLNGSDQTNVKAWDFDNDGLRTFTRTKISNVRFLGDDELKMVNVDNLPKNVARNLDSEFGSEGWKTFRNGDILVAVKVDKTKDTILLGSPHGRYILMYSKTGKSITLFLNHSVTCNDIKLVLEGNTITNRATTIDLQKALNT